MLFFSFFKTLVDHEVTVELKNDILIKGTLKSVDQYLNIKLEEIQVLDDLKHPHLASVKNVFIRGSVVRYVHLPGGAVDTALLEDGGSNQISTRNQTVPDYRKATRREAANQATKLK
ncbi:U6 snRNA-associated Sm-like protein LSm2 [Erysiphe neolycopersici]|uniref:U6 snRNA-associated Sm-like protein LSm2 n=1 Tax=Erysiphe neolycopersici TaxID=212602 RepID=A0A420HUI2_9PEZI|nr:U6 snRNA-associated Sm-like protein LSm2 [Erysiphe neolycopersici]